MLSPRRFAQLGLASAAALFATCVTVLGYASLADQRALSTRTGVVAPDFRLPEAADPIGRSLRLSDLRGSTVVVAFGPSDGWAADDQDRRMAELAARYAGGGVGGGERVRFLSVNAGEWAANVGGPPANGRGLVAVGKSRVERLLDADGSVAKRYATSAEPTFLVIDPAGVIRYRGPLPEADGKSAGAARAAAVG